MTQSQLSFLNAKATRYFELKAMIDALTAESDEIKDLFKTTLADEGTNDLTGDGWKASIGKDSITDSVPARNMSKLLEEFPEAYEKYAVISTRRGAFSLKATA